MDHVYNCSFGYVIDHLQEGQIAENNDSIFIVKRNGLFYSGMDVNTTVTLSASYRAAKWRITPFFERRICGCGCKAPLLPLTKEYEAGERAENHLSDYYDHKNDQQPIIGLVN